MMYPEKNNIATGFFFTAPKFLNYKSSPIPVFHLPLALTLHHKQTRENLFKNFLKYQI